MISHTDWVAKWPGDSLRLRFLSLVLFFSTAYGLGRFIKTRDLGHSLIRTALAACVYTALGLLVLAFKTWRRP
jgi:hypothetical protein